uniref:ULP_PROTEASE domain-containing protein n=1 Tax=Steinernema glaseri TaxID=37863 RepID=A0A1I7YW27_9BILA
MYNFLTVTSRLRSSSQVSSRLHPFSTVSLRRQPSLPPTASNFNCLRFLRRQPPLPSLSTPVSGRSSLPSGWSAVRRHPKPCLYCNLPSLFPNKGYYTIKNQWHRLNSPPSHSRAIMRFQRKNEASEHDSSRLHPSRLKKKLLAKSGHDCRKRLRQGHSLDSEPTTGETAYTPVYAGNQTTVYNSLCGANASQYGRVLIPINQDDVHWQLGVLNVEQRSVVVYDSMVGSTTKQQLLGTYQARRLKEIAANIINKRQGLSHSTGAIREDQVLVIRAPASRRIQQVDGYNYGVHVIDNARRYMQAAPHPEPTAATVVNIADRSLGTSRGRIRRYINNVRQQYRTYLFQQNPQFIPQATTHIIQQRKNAKDLKMQDYWAYVDDEFQTFVKRIDVSAPDRVEKMISKQQTIKRVNIDTTDRDGAQKSHSIFRAAQRKKKFSKEFVSVQAERHLERIDKPEVISVSEVASQLRVMFVDEEKLAQHDDENIPATLEDLCCSLEQDEKLSLVVEDEEPMAEELHVDMKPKRTTVSQCDSIQRIRHVYAGNQTALYNRQPVVNRQQLGRSAAQL